VLIISKKKFFCGIQKKKTTCSVFQGSIYVQDKLYGDLNMVLKDGVYAVFIIFLRKTSLLIYVQHLKSPTAEVGAQVIEKSMKTSLSHVQDVPCAD
jgi:hypothetical protein